MFVRIARIEVDPTHLEAFTSAVVTEMDESVRIEGGVLAIYAVSEEDAPSLLHFFEIYANEDAYRAHLESPHFLRFRATTDPLVRSRELIDTVPIHLSSKAPL